VSAPRGEVAPGHEIAKVRAAHCQAVIDAAVREGVAPGQLRAVLSSAFETALRWGLVPVNPCEPRQRRPGRAQS